MRHSAQPPRTLVAISCWIVACVVLPALGLSRHARAEVERETERGETPQPTTAEDPSSRPTVEPEPMTLEEEVSDPPPRSETPRRPVTTTRPQSQTGASSGRGDHLHDGFYFRVGLGYGTNSMTTTGGRYSTGWAVPDVHVEGSGIALDLFVGATPIAGLVVGGTVFLNGSGHPTVEVNGKRYDKSDTNGTINLFLLGPFVDGFFDPKSGFHLGGALGHVNFFYELDEKPDPETGWLSNVCPSHQNECASGGVTGATGAWGVALFTGYDAFVSPNWSLGGLARLLIFSQAAGEFGIEASGWGFAATLTALHH